jgi:hypothetical protein
MALEEKREALSRTSPAAREEKRDASIFGGKPGMEKGSLNYKLRDPEMYRGTELGEQRRTELGKKMFGGEDYVKKSDLEWMDKELDQGKWGKFKEFSERDRLDSKKLIRKMLGEKK